MTEQERKLIKDFINRTEQGGRVVMESEVIGAIVKMIYDLWKYVVQTRGDKMITNKEAIAYFERHLDLYCVDGISREAEKKAIKALEQQPKTGHWEQFGNSWENKFKCSECGDEQPKILRGERIIGHWSDYCPNCGADMRGEEV